MGLKWMLWRPAFSAVDPVTGHVLKVDVTLTVLK
jgi:hypothetical protein